MSKQVPAGWQVKVLEECINGNPEYGANASAIDFSRSLPRYIRITDITEDGYLSNADIKSIPIKEGGNYYLDDGDFLFARTGASVGKTYLYKRKDGVAAFAGYLIRYRTNNEVLIPEYLFQYTHSSDYKNWVKSTTRTGAQPNINAQEYASILLTLPPLPEQRKIAAVLSAADRSIAATEKLTAKLADLKQALMQQLLTKGIGHTEFKPSPLGLIPKSWEVKELGEIAATRTGKMNPLVDDKIKYVGLEHIDNGAITNNGYMWSNATTSLNSLFKKNDILFGKLRPYLRKCIQIGFDGCCSGELLVLKANSEITNQNYLKCILQSNPIYTFCDELSAGTKMPRVSWGDLKHFTALVPPLPEQQKIAAILNTVDSKLSAAKVKLAKAKDLKQGLMNDLLTGKVRVSA